MLIARALPIMRVYIKPGGQRGYSGYLSHLAKMAFPTLFPDGKGDPTNYIIKDF